MELQFPFSLKEILIGGLLPAAVTFAVAAIIRITGRSDRFASAVVNVVLAGGVLVAVRFVSLSAWMPKSHWHWLPFAALLFAVLNPLLAHRKWIVPILVACAASAVTAWLIVPNWDDLPLPRLALVSLVTLILAAIGLLLQPLCQRVDRRVLAIVLAGSSLSGAMVLTCAGSLRLGLIGVAVAAAFVGLMCAQWIRRSEAQLPDVAFVVSALVGGMMIVRRLNSDTGLPLVCFFLPPLAPLTLWLVELAPLKRMASAKRVALQIGMPAVMALIALGIAVASMLSSMDASGY